MRGSHNDRSGPGYLALLERGELEARVIALEALLGPCVVCPLDCGTDRMAGEPGRCFTGAEAVVSSWTPHFGEEPVLTGTRGVGNVFFGQCNLRCVYCQNWQISQQAKRPSLGGPMSAEALADVYLKLQARGCHAIGWVSPTHVAPQAARALLIAARRGLRLPIVYNTNAYDALPVLRLLEGVVDIWLPDLKYGDDATAWELSKIPEYTRHARAAVLEMARQVGSGLQLDAAGVATRGLIVRHLILPNDLAGSEATVRWLRETLGPRVQLSLMCQYFPTHKTEGAASRYPLLTRRIRASEYAEVLELVDELGFESGFAQDLETAADYYRPDFNDHARPFADVADFIGSPSP